MLTRTSLERKEVSLPFSGHKDMAIGRAAKKLGCLGPMELEALAIIAQPAVHHIGRSPRWRLEQERELEKRNSLTPTFQYFQCSPRTQALPVRCGSCPRRNGACAQRGECRGQAFRRVSTPNARACAMPRRAGSCCRAIWRVFRRSAGSVGRLTPRAEVFRLDELASPDSAALQPSSLFGWNIRIRKAPERQGPSAGNKLLSDV